MIATRYPSANTVVLGTWNTATNAYADDGAYMTTVGARNANWEIRFSDFGFSIPAGSTINSLKWEMEYKLSTTASASTITFLSKYNNVSRGTNWVSTAEPLTDTLVTSTANGTWTVEELNSNLCEATIIVRRSSNTACTYSFDFVRIVVDYTPPITHQTMDSETMLGSGDSSVPSISVGSSLGVPQFITVVEFLETYARVYKDAILNSVIMGGSGLAEFPEILVSGKLMTLDAFLNLFVLGEVVEGTTVNLDRYGILTITEIIEGSTLNLSPSGVLTVNSITEGVL